MLKQRLAAVEQSRSSLVAYGLAKLSDSSSVTDSSGLALPASEKNSGISGTLANEIKKVQSTVDGISRSLFEARGEPSDANQATQSGIYIIGGRTSNTAFDYGVLVVFATGGYVLQIGKSVVVSDARLCVRTRTETGNWSAWRIGTLQG